MYSDLRYSASREQINHLPDRFISSVKVRLVHGACFPFGLQ